MTNRDRIVLFALLLCALAFDSLYKPSDATALIYGIGVGWILVDCVRFRASLPSWELPLAIVGAVFWPFVTIFYVCELVVGRNHASK